MVNILASCNSMRKAVVCFAAIVGLATASQIPSGTQLQLRLTTALNTSTAKANQSFEAVLIVPVLSGEQIAIPPGARISGHIKEVKPAPEPNDQAVLDLAFDKITDAGGKSTPISARVFTIDNARETVDDQGKILGIIASQTGSGRLDQGISKVTDRYPGLGDLLGAVKQTFLKAPDGNIDYEAGTEFAIELTKPLDWKGTSRMPDVRGIEPAEELARVVNLQPFRTTAAERPPRPSDVTNLMFLGSREDLETAFRRAGWFTAAQLDSKSKLETFRAMAEQRGYQEAPVSLLLLEGQPPDLVFEKQNNTFAARHHLRIWKRPGRFHGQEIWVCAATHDIGIDYSQENHTFIHKIDSQIDRERAKVVYDLLFTGLVQGLSLVERTGIPSDLYNATGDRLETDGKMAVVSF